MGFSRPIQINNRYLEPIFAVKKLLIVIIIMKPPNSSEMPEACLLNPTNRTFLRLRNISYKFE